MINEFKCVCGNDDPKKAYYYDGCLGYEAIICKKCGCYYDHEGKHIADNFSKQFIEYM